MLSIACIGEVARACLNRHHQGVVESVFRRSAYIAFDDTYMCIALSSVGRGPLNILYVADKQALHCALRPAATVFYCHCEQTLCINNIVIAKLAQARICDSSAKPIRLDAIPLRTNRQCLSCMSMPASGLFSLVVASNNGLLSGIDSRLQKNPTLDLALAQFALPILNNLIDWLKSATGDDDCVLKPHESIGNLLGAGQGLTPSGDDLLAGVLLALQVSGFARTSAILWAHLQPAVAIRTNVISATLLQQAAQGRAGEFALAAIAIYASEGILDTGKLSSVLASIGETSGWDFFAGVVLVLDAVAAADTESASAGICS